MTGAAGEPTSGFAVGQSAVDILTQSHARESVPNRR